MALQSINRSPFENHPTGRRSSDKPAPVNPQQASHAPTKHTEVTQVRESALANSGEHYATTEVQSAVPVSVSEFQNDSAAVTDTGSPPQTTEEFLAMIGGRVRSRRNSLGMSRKRLAAGSGVSERYLAQLEAGQGNMSIALLRKVAFAMEMPLDVLIKDPTTTPDLKSVTDKQLTPQTGGSHGLTSVGRTMNATG